MILDTYSAGHLKLEKFIFCFSLIVLDAMCWKFFWVIIRPLIAPRKVFRQLDSKICIWDSIIHNVNKDFFPIYPLFCNFLMSVKNDFRWIWMVKLVMKWSWKCSLVNFIIMFYSCSIHRLIFSQIMHILPHFRVKKGLCLHYFGQAGICLYLKQRPSKPYGGQLEVQFWPW